MSTPQTFDAFVPSNIAELLSRAKFQSTYVPFDRLRTGNVDIEAKYTATLKLMERVSSRALSDHSLRCYYYSLLILESGFPSNTPGVPQITHEELVRRIYLTCILHDLGLSLHEEMTSHPAHAMTFELHGGIIAYEHLRAEYPSLDPVQVGDVAQSIVQHTSAYERGLHSAAGTLMQLSAIFDVAGYTALGPGVLELILDRKSVKEVETAFPRGTLNHELSVGTATMLKEKPGCLFSHIPPHLQKALLENTSMSWADSV